MEKSEEFQYHGSFRRIHPVIDPDRDLYEPIGRSGHCCVADENNLYVFGGYNPKEGPLLIGHGAATYFTPSRQVMAELWVFNFARKIWRKIVSSDTPNAAASSCMKLVNKKIYVYGGTVFPFGHLMSNFLHSCDISNGFQWQLISATGNSDQLPPRAYGQSLVFHEGALYTFGGAISFYMEPISDLHRLCLSPEKGGVNTWERLRPTGDVPKGRYKQEVAVDEDRFYVLGGGHLAGAESLERIHSFSFQDNHWSLVTTKPDDIHGFPKPRSCFGCIQKRKTVLICGGRNYDIIEVSNEGLEDIWSLSLVDFQWTKLPMSLPKAMYFHGTSLNSLGTLYVYGGIIDGEDARSSELYKIQLTFPALSELSWECVLGSIHNIDSLPLENFYELGIPQSFVNRLKIS